MWNGLNRMQPEGQIKYWDETHGLWHHTVNSIAEDIKKIISDVGAGVSAISVEEIKKKLVEFYQEYKKQGSISYRGDKNKIENYSYRSMAKKFAELLNQITSQQKAALSLLG